MTTNDVHAPDRETVATIGPRSVSAWGDKPHVAPNIEAVRAAEAASESAWYPDFDEVE